MWEAWFIRHFALVMLHDNVQQIISRPNFHRACAFDRFSGGNNKINEVYSVRFKLSNLKRFGCVSGEIGFLRSLTLECEQKAARYYIYPRLHIIIKLKSPPSKKILARIVIWEKNKLLIVLIPLTSNRTDVYLQFNWFHRSGIEKNISEKELSPKWESSENWHTPFKCNLAKWSLIAKNARKLEKASQQNIHFRLIIVFLSAIVGSSNVNAMPNTIQCFLSLSHSWHFCLMMEIDTNV